MYFLPDLVLQTILFRNRIPVELRFIICMDYFPFLPNAQDALTVDDLHRLRCRDGWYHKITTKIYVSDLVDTSTTFALQIIIIHKRIIVRILATFYATYLQLKKKGLSPLDEYLRPSHPDISFTQTSFRDFSFDFRVIQLQHANVESVHHAITKWYYNIIFLAIYRKDEIGI